MKVFDTQFGCLRCPERDICKKLCGRMEKALGNRRKANRKRRHCPDGAVELVGVMPKESSPDGFCSLQYEADNQVEQLAGVI